MIECPTHDTYKPQEIIPNALFLHMYW